MTLLALGITLTTLAGLGASAIVSVPYTISRGFGLNFANLTLIFYCSFVAAEHQRKPAQMAGFIADSREHSVYPVYGAVSVGNSL
mgnify:CR=1 FL=1